MVLGDAPAMDALYMTVITVAAVGYSESIALEGTARLFTMVVIILGVGSITFVLVSGLDFVLEGHLEDLLGRRRMDRDLARLNNHTIVCGFGQVGRHVAMSLIEDGEPAVVVDVNAGRVESARAQELLAVEGDAAQEDTLARVGIASARAVVACVHDDADNVLISLTAKGLNPWNLRHRPHQARRERGQGATCRRGPRDCSGRHRRSADRHTGHPARNGGLPRCGHARYGGGPRARGGGGACGGPLVGWSLRQLQMRQRHGLTVLAVQSGGRSTNKHPPPDTRLSAGDVLVVIASRKALTELRS